MSLKKNSYSLIELIKYIIKFFIARKKYKSDKLKDKSDNMNSDIQDDFKKIDSKKEKDKNQKLEKRLNNMFD